MSYLLRSERLSLRPCQMSDLDAVHQLWTAADVRRFLFDDRQITREEATSFIEIRVLEALGMSRTRRVIVNERPLLYYEIQTWRKNAAEKSSAT